MQIVVASRNKKKIGELQVLLRSEIAKKNRKLAAEGNFALPEIELLSLDDIGFTDEIEETGTTFADNALIKASVPAARGYIGLADDSGLAVDALGGAPGVYSARYAGEPCNDENNNQKLLRELDATPDAERTAHYVCCVACVFPDGRQFTVQGTCDGLILREYHGDGGFGYDPLFFYPEFDKTFAEVPLEKKNRASHRAKAVAAFADVLDRYLPVTAPLSSKPRAYLRSLANDMKPIFQVGKNGGDGDTAHQIANALEARELIKISVLETCPYTARGVAESLAAETRAYVVAVTGRKIVLYRAAADPAKRKIVLP